MSEEIQYDIEALKEYNASKTCSICYTYYRLKDRFTTKCEMCFIDTQEMPKELFVDVINTEMEKEKKQNEIKKQAELQKKQQKKSKKLKQLGKNCHKINKMKCKYIKLTLEKVSKDWNEKILKKNKKKNKKNIKKSEKQHKNTLTQMYNFEKTKSWGKYVEDNNLHVKWIKELKNKTKKTKKTKNALKSKKKRRYLPKQTNTLTQMWSKKN